MATTELVQQLSLATSDVARNLPEAHWITRWYREARFRAAVERVIGTLYKINVSSLTDEQLEETEQLTRAAVNLVEAHMLLRYTPADVAECGYCTDAIDRLRDALDALDAGLPTDPRKRPSNEELFREVSGDLRRVG